MLAMGLVRVGQQLVGLSVDLPLAVWQLGFGKPSLTVTTADTGSQLLWPHGDNPFQLVLLANIPQLVLSTGYLLLNNLLTDMLGAWEWSKIGKNKTKLRTTIPRGQQRSTYFLQLPYTYALPLMIIMIAIHYIVSSSLFVVDIIAYYFDSSGDLTMDSGTSGWLLNYSPLAIICALAASLLPLGLLIALSHRKLYPGLPMAGSCSALISAACHPPPEEGDAGLLPVQWGVVKSTINPETGVGHCSISSGEVSAPVEGQLYS
jgi:hypothetical protein